GDHRLSRDPQHELQCRRRADRLRARGRLSLLCRGRARSARCGKFASQARRPAAWRPHPRTDRGTGVMRAAYARFMTVRALLRLGAGSAILAYGYYITRFALTPKLAAFALGLFALPLLGQLTRRPLVQAYTLWWGVFLVLQSLLSPLLLGDSFNLVT